MLINNIKNPSHKNLKMINSIYYIILLLLVVMPIASCGKGKAPKPDVSEIEKCDSLPEGVKKLVRIVADNDNSGFAAMVSYPLSRPYPLHDIENQEQMKVYYSVMVDDSLRNAIAGSHPEDWDEYGWRGWSLKGGGYVWIDDSLYDVSYLSARERVMLDSLTAKDMESVESGLRQGWTPVMCLKGNENGAVYRIDMSRTEKGAPHYRMLVYDKDTDLRSVPTIVYEGHKETEGTAGTSTYYFTDADGHRAVFVADIPDGSMPKIEFTDTIIPVVRAYWLDLTK